MTTLMLIAIIFSIGIILLSYTITHKSNYPITFNSVNNTIESRSQYECGIEPFEEEIGIETRERTYIKFYIVGILFLIFDLETLLILPATLLLQGGVTLSPLVKVVPLGLKGGLSSQILESNERSIHFEDSLMFVNHTQIYIVLLLFIIVLLLGLIYEYRKNIL